MLNASGAGLGLNGHQSSVRGLIVMRLKPISIKKASSNTARDDISLRAMESLAMPRPTGSLFAMLRPAEPGGKRSKRRH